MTNIQPRSVDILHHKSSVSSTEKAMALVNDLHCTIRYITMGVVTISSQPAQSCNGITWVIRGPKKNLVVMLQYEHDSHAQDEEERTDAAISIKVEAPEAEDEQSQDALCDDIQTRYGERRTSEIPMDGCNARVKAEGDCYVRNRVREENPETDKRTDWGDDHDNTSSVSADGNSTVDYRLKRVSLLDFSLSYRPSTETKSATSTSKTMKQEGNLTSCKNALMRNDVGATEEHDLSSGKSFKVCKTYLCLDAAIPTVVDEDDSQGHAETVTSRAEIQLTAGKPSYESVHLPGVHYQCSYCEKKFYDMKKFTEHEKLHTVKPLKCSYCPKSFILSSHLKLHEKLHAAKRPHQCPECEKSFASLASLKRHEMVHTGEKPHTCSQCGKCFALAKTLKRHEKAHTEEREYKCSQCDKSFSLSTHLRRHELIHNDEKRFRCSMCEMKFTRADILKKHEKSHAGVMQCMEMGENTFQCSYCGKIFLRLTECKQHERIHTGDRPYQCSYCDRTFSYPTSLKCHERVHTGERPYKCSHCSKSFLEASGLKRHELTHSGKKGYQCNYCEKKFLRSETLKDHERVHTGEKPYECPQCDMRFTRSQQLKVHSRTHLPKHPATPVPIALTIKQEPDPEHSILS